MKKSTLLSWHSYVENYLEEVKKNCLKNLCEKKCSQNLCGILHEAHHIYPCNMFLKGSRFIFKKRRSSHAKSVSQSFFDVRYYGRY